MEKQTLFHSPTRSRKKGTNEHQTDGTNRKYIPHSVSLCFIYFIDNKIFENKLNFYQNPCQSLHFPFVCPIF